MGKGETLTVSLIQQTMKQHWWFVTVSCQALELSVGAIYLICLPPYLGGFQKNVCKYGYIYISLLVFSAGMTRWCYTVSVCRVVGAIIYACCIHVHAIICIVDNKEKSLWILVWTWYLHVVFTLWLAALQHVTIVN